MAKKRHGSRPASTPRTTAASRRLDPDRLVLVLAVAGLLISGYLGFFASSGAAPLLCGPESGCAVIQNSTYATLLGLPTALWGFGLYLVIAWSALLMPPRKKRWVRLAWLSTIGFMISVYFTLLGWLALDATCGWCLASAAVMTALWLSVMVRRPASGPGMSWPVFARNLLIGSGFVTGLLLAWQAGWLQPPEDPRLRALAEHLDESGARYYGAYWCPNCQEQRRLFGRSADRLPYVECTPGGRGSAMAFACVAAEISGYPTWIIDGRRFQRLLTPDELARLSRFDFDADAPARPSGQPQE